MNVARQGQKILALEHRNALFSHDRGGLLERQLLRHRNHKHIVPPRRALRHQRFEHVRGVLAHQARRFHAAWRRPVRRIGTRRVGDAHAVQQAHHIGLVHGKAPFFANRSAISPACWSARCRRDKDCTARYTGLARCRGRCPSAADTLPPHSSSRGPDDRSCRR